jgi:hypothetical protein
MKSSAGYRAGMSIDGPTSALQYTSHLSKDPSLKYQSRSARVMSFWISLYPAC